MCGPGCRGLQCTRRAVVSYQSASNQLGRHARLCGPDSVASARGESTRLPSGASAPLNSHAHNEDLLRLAIRSVLQVGEDPRVLVCRKLLRVGGACGPPPPVAAPLVPRCALLPAATPRKRGYSPRQPSTPP